MTGSHSSSLREAFAAWLRGLPVACPALRRGSAALVRQGGRAPCGTRGGRGPLPRSVRAAEATLSPVLLRRDMEETAPAAQHLLFDIYPDGARPHGPTVARRTRPCCLPSSTERNCWMGPGWRAALVALS